MLQVPLALQGDERVALVDPSRLGRRERAQVLNTVPWAFFVCVLRDLDRDLLDTS